MSGIALDHPMIREYLRALDTALGALPSEQASELREQITAHLEDALAPDSADAEVSEALRRLGSPSEVAAAAGSKPRPTPTASDAGLWLRTAIGRRTWKFWSVLSAIVLLIGGFTWYIDSINSAPVLVVGGEMGWWYRQDAMRQVNTSADGAVPQTTVPVRWHQRQGFYVQIQNTSSWTQTVLGLARNSPQALDSLTGQLAVSVDYDPRTGWPGDPLTVRYNLPVSIPPGQSRYLRLIWTSNICQLVGGSEGTDQLILRVRVGWLTRSETVLLGQGWFVAGTKQSSCS